MSPTAIFLFKWLQQNASSRAKSGTDRGSQTRGKRRGQMIYWKRLLLGATERECKDGQWAKVWGETVSDEPDWKLFMACRGRADPGTAPRRILEFSLMSFCSPLMATWPRQWGEEGGVHSRGGPGSGEWFILPPCHSLWATPLEMASNVTVLRRKISTLCLSVTAAQTDLLTSYVLLLALCVCISQSSTFQGSRHNVTPGWITALHLNLEIFCHNIYKGDVCW